MTGEMVPRWEWRAFGRSFGGAEERFGALSPERVQESDELYLLSRTADENVKGPIPPPRPPARASGASS